MNTHCYTMIYVFIYSYIFIGVGGREPVHGMRISCVRGGVALADLSWVTRKCGDASLLFRPGRLLRPKVPPGALPAPPGNFYALFCEKLHFASKGAPGRPGLPPNHQKTMCVGYVSALGPPRGATATKGALLRTFSILGPRGRFWTKNHNRL